MKKYQLILLIPFLLINACSSEENATPTEPAKEINEEQIFQNQIQALEKAKEVEGLLKKRENKQQQIIENK